jgi:hypothetical protein
MSLIAIPQEIRHRMANLMDYQVLPMMLWMGFPIGS